MVDSSAASSQTAAPTRTVWLKRLDLSQIKPDKFPTLLPDLTTLLTSLQKTPVSEVAIPNTFRLKFDEDSLPGKNYTVKLDDRPTTGAPNTLKANQTQFMYLDDVVALVLDSIVLLEALYPTRPAIQVFKRNDTRGELERLVRPALQNQTPDYADLRRRQKDIAELAAQTIEVIRELSGAGPQAADQTDSLRPLLSLLRDPAQALATWRSDILPLAKALRDVKNLPTKTVTVTENLPSLPPATHGGRYSPVEIRLVLHTFIADLQTIFKDADGTKKYLQPYLKKTDLERSITTILDPDDLKALLSTNAEFYFSEESLDLIDVLADANNVRESDQLRSRAFHTFFTKKEVMGRIFGTEKLPELVATAVGAAGGEEGGGESPAVVEVVEKRVQFLTISEALLRIYPLLTDSVLVRLSLNNLTDSTLLTLIRHQITNDIITRLTIPTDLMNATVSDATGPDGKPASGVVYDKTTRQIVSSLFEKWLTAYIPVATAEFLGRVGKLEVYSKLLVDQATLLVEVYNGQKEPDPDQVPISAVTVPVVLGQLQQNLSEDERKLLPADASQFTAEWWRHLSLADRRRLAGNALGPTLGVAGEKVRLANVLAINYFGSAQFGLPGFDPTKLTGAERELFGPIHEAFIANIEITLSSLSYEDFLRCLSNPTYARLYVLNKIRGRLNQDPRFLGLIQRFFDAKTEIERQAAAAALAGQAKPDGSLELQFNQTIDTLLVTFQDEASAKKYLDSLSPDELSRHFGAPISADQAGRFKAELAKLLKARYRSENFRLNQQLQNEGHTRQAQGLGLYTFDDQTTEDQRAELDDLVERYRKVVKVMGVRAVITGYHTPYSAAQTAPAPSDAEAISEWKYRKALAEALWEELYAAELVSAAQTDPNFVPATVIQELNSDRERTLSKAVLGTRFQRYFNRLRGQQPPTIGKHLQNIGLKAAETAAVQSGAALADILLPGAGAPIRIANTISNVLEQIGIPKKYQTLGALGLLGGLIARFPLAFGGAAGGAAIGATIGSVIPGVGTVLGGTIGGTVGGVVGLGGDIALHTGTNVLGSLQDAGRSILGGSPAAGGSGIATQPINVGGAGVASKVPFLATSAAPVVIASVGTAALAMVTNLVIQSSFLDPLPTLDSANEISKYVKIEKVAKPGIAFTEAKGNLSFPITIEYSIKVTAREHELIITDINDTITTTYNTETKPGASKEPKVRNRTEFGLTEPSSSIILAPGESIDLPGYQEVYDESYLDSNVTNTVTLVFTATKDDETVDDTAKTAEVICIGACPQSQKGCWPASGFIVQGPGSTPRTSSMTTGTHGTTSDPLQAVDITYNKSADLPIKVYATYAGQACAKPEGTGWQCKAGTYTWCYGNHVLLDTDEGFQLGYAHLESFGPTLVAGQCVAVKPGDVLGNMGGSGGWAIHLHYEMRPKNQFQIQDYVPETIELKAVRSCYDY